MISLDITGSHRVNIRFANSLFYRYSILSKWREFSTQESDEEDDDEGEETLIDPGNDNILRKFLDGGYDASLRKHRKPRLVNVRRFVGETLDEVHDLFAGIDAAGEAYDDDADEDPELVHDSIYHLNMSQYLRDFLLNFSTHHCFPMYLQHLNVPELKVLNNININALM